MLITNIAVVTDKTQRIFDVLVRKRTAVFHLIYAFSVCPAVRSFMARWSGILRVPLYPNSKSHYRVAVSLCLASSLKSLTTPSANAIFFNGDRVEGTGNPVIERLSDLQRIAEILASKFGSSVNVWVIEASTFNGPFAVYKDFIPSVNSWGEPKSYNSNGFPASASTATLLSNCLKEAKKLPFGKQKEAVQAGASASCLHQPRTFILGFSKGGTVLNQLVTELGFSAFKSSEQPGNVDKQLMAGGHINVPDHDQIIPTSAKSLLNSISEIHYVDVGLNSSGAYLTDGDAIEKLSKRLAQGTTGLRFVLHGTPKQWCDSRRGWIKNEKEKLLRLLKLGSEMSGGKLQVCERFYLADKPPSMQMHFEVIDHLDVS